MKEILEHSIDTLLHTGDYPWTAYLGNPEKAELEKQDNNAARETFEQIWTKRYENEELVFENTESGLQEVYKNIQPNWKNNHGMYTIWATNTKSVFNMIADKKPVSLTNIEIAPLRDEVYIKDPETRNYFEDKGMQPTERTQALLEELASYSTSRR